MWTVGLKLMDVDDGFDWSETWVDWQQGGALVTRSIGKDVCTRTEFTTLKSQTPLNRGTKSPQHHENEAIKSFR
jgi:hypothetical protein